jgi:DNA-binding NarL/FixJ family response regulator
MNTTAGGAGTAVMLVSTMTADQHAAMAGPPVRVAVVDNDTLLVEALRLLFADEPSLRFVGAASTVADGIELVAHRQPDVLVVDVRMPAGGGAAVAAQAREVAPRTAVLAMSASDDEDARAEMAEAGAVGYLVKNGGSAVGELLHTIDVVGHLPSR